MPSRAWLVLKVLIIGDSGVGKTSLFNQFVCGRFSNSYDVTVGTDFLSKEMVIDDKVVTLQLWDTAGQERFQSLGVAFYRRADACMLVYDLTRRSTFRSLDSWRDEFLIQANPWDADSFPFVLVGNKVDLELCRLVTKDEALEWAQRRSSTAYYECSAREPLNVKAAFAELAKRALARKLTEAENSAHGAESLQLSWQSCELQHQPQGSASWASGCYC